jgi:MOSC domain-containing protein YiiM
VTATSGELVAVNLAKVRPNPSTASFGPTDRKPQLTGIDKRSVTEPVQVGRLGLTGDTICDTANHGGPDQAVYAYAEEDAAWFAGELGREVPPGLFGENLTTRGVDVTGAVIGERWLVGEQLLLEVTAPRTPCGTFERRMGLPGWQDRFREHGAPGCYFRVLRAGAVRQGDAIEVAERPDHGITIGGWFGRQDPDDAAALLDADATGAVRLHEHLRRHAERSLRIAARA